MTPASLAYRNALATAQMMEAVETLATRFGLPTTDLRIRERDPQVQSLYQREAVAHFLQDLVAASAGPATATPIPALGTVEEFEVPAAAESRKRGRPPRRGRPPKLTEAPAFDAQGRPLPVGVA